MRVCRFFVLAVLMGMAGCFIEKAEVHNPVNLALNKPYVFNIKPDYTYCTDPADTKQLTDGKIMHEVSSNWFWINKETVGWNRPKNSVEITVDLGDIKPISGFSFHTAAGRDDVNWPAVINVLVSENGKEFYNIVDMASFSHEALSLSEKEGYAIYNYSAQGLRTKGRYVKFQCIPSGIYLFCDEIEVFSEPDSNLKAEFSKSKFIAENSETQLMTTCIRKRMLCDIFYLRNELEKSKITLAEKNDISETLDTLEKKAMGYEFSGNPKQFKAIIPVNSIHSEIISVFATLLRGEGFSGLNIWHKDRYARLAMFEKPSGEKPRLSVKMMNEEYRADILNITNCENKTVKISFRIDGLPGGTNPSYLKVSEVKGVDTKNFKVDFSALLPVRLSSDGSYSVDVLPGMTCQLWFSFHPQNLTPGNYQGNLKLYRDSKIIQSVPLEFAVSTVKFPSKTILKCFLWDYSFTQNYAIGRGNLKEAVSMLKEYFINIPVSSAAVASIPKSTDFDKTGKLLRQLNFSFFDKWIKLWPAAAAYRIFLNITPDNQNFAGFTPGSPEFERAVAEWALSFSEHVKSKGIDPAKVQFNILDEPRKPEHYQINGKWSAAIKKSGAGLSIFSDPIDLEKLNNMQYAPTALKNIDVLCPLMACYISYPKDICDFFQKERTAGKELWFYMCTEPNRQFDPSYFRLQPWQAFIFNATGSGFWSFSDTGKLASNWNPYTNPAGYNYDYSPVYISPDSITTAKQMEAIREGIEDYQYLVMLKNAASDNTAKEEALDLIKKTNESSGKNYWIKWDTKKTPCSFADNARLKVLDRLEQLKNK